MRLNVKNFIGKLPNGNRYKLVVTTINNLVNAFLYEEVNGMFSVESVSQCFFKTGNLSYLEALSQVLIAMQNTYHLRLIK